MELDEIKPFVLENFDLKEEKESPSNEEAHLDSEEAPQPPKETKETDSSQMLFEKVDQFETLDSLNTPSLKGEPLVIEEMEQIQEDEQIEKSHNFHSSEFTAESSLLTNAEDYAKTIREGARIYSERMNAEADEIHQQAQQARAEAEALKQVAEKEKQTLLQATQDQVESIKKEAYQEGFSEGKEAGTQQRYQELAPQIARIDELLLQLSQLRQVVRFQGEQELLQLALLIAKKIVMEELTTNPDVLYNITRAALQEIEALGKIRILIHPTDYEFLVNARTQLENYLKKEEQTLVIEANIDAEPGEILVETDETIVDFHFQKQFEAIEEALKRRLEERQTQLHHVDMDAHDFNISSNETPLPPSPKDSAPPSFPEDSASSLFPTGQDDSAKA